jgi:putative transcription antitermination factor YqgF
MRAIALDIGNRYIGIAMQDHASDITYRYSTLDRKKEDVFLLLNKICSEENIDTIVAGIPYHVEDGSETEQTRLTRAFLVELKNKIKSVLNIVEIDETLTSKEAKRTLAIEGAQATEEHAEAARILLAEYLALGR